VVLRVNEVGVDAVLLESCFNCLLNLLFLGLFNCNVVFSVNGCLGNAFAVNSNGVH
jgi:hypothetical protein